MSHEHHLKPNFETIEELKREVDRLFELQREALERATYLGMTPDEARQMEARRKRITVLVDELAALKRRE
jgi:hypothetical protein